MKVEPGPARRILLLLLVSSLFACPDEKPVPPAPTAPTPKSEGHLVHRSHRTMGTQVTITAYVTDEAPALAGFSAAFAEFDRLERLLTVWRDESDVSRINAAAGERAVKVSPETIEVVSRALALSRATEGKFDITFGALAGLWKFDHDQDNSIPTDAAIAKRLPFIGWEHVTVEPGARTIKLEKKGMRMHLGGIGKGYAVDRAVAILREHGLSDFMIQAGGDLFVAGHKGDRNWRVGIRDPRGPPSEFFAAAEVTDATFSTSGDYERFFERDGVRYHHILDPDSGRPARVARSVTIMAPDAMTADALSTGVFILGPKKGLPVIEALPGVGAVIVDAENQVHVSKRLEGRVKLLSKPTP